MAIQFKRYLTSWRRFTRSMGFGIHSPFAYSFVVNVLSEHHRYYAYECIATNRKLVAARLRRRERRSRLLSESNARLLFRVANFYNPEKILQIGTNYGFTASTLLQVSSTTQLILCEPNKERIEKAQPLLTSISDRVSLHSNVNASLIEYFDENDSFPFVVVDAVQSEDYADVLARLRTVVGNEGVVIVCNLSRNKSLRCLWSELVNGREHGMTFSNGKIAVLIADKKLLPQDFSLWL